MKNRTVICEGSNSNRKFRVVEDVYYQDGLDEDKTLMLTNVFADIEVKLQVKILCFWFTIKTNVSYNKDDEDYLCKITASDFNRLTD